MRKTVLWMAGVLVLTACDRTNETENASSDPVALTVSGHILTNTRATATAWDAGDAIGIFASGGATAGNRKYVTASGTANFLPEDETQTIWYPVADDAPKVDVVAYHPYNATQSGPGYAIDVSVQSNQRALDLLSSVKVTGKDKNNPAVALDFRHRMTKMELAIEAGTGVDATHLTGLRVEITGQQTAGTCDLNTGVVTASGATSAIVMKTTTDGASAEATILPAAAAAGKQIVFTLSSGEPFRYTIPADRAFNPGELHEYRITLHRTEVTVSATIKDWTKVPGSGTAK